MTPPNCWSGNSQDNGDSGGVEWQGEQGKGAPAPAPGPDPAPGPAPAPGPGPAPAPGGDGGGPGCVGVHCTQMAMQESWGAFFCVALGGVCGLYILGGMYTNGGTPPNAHFWKTLGGLVKDGVVYTTGVTVEKSSHMYEPVPRMAAGAPGLQAGGAMPYQQYPGGVVVHGQPAQPPAVPEYSPMQIMCPPTAGPGMSVEIVVPSTGQPMTVQIPAGAVPNQPFTVQVPASIAGTPGRGSRSSRSRRSGSTSRDTKKKRKADKEERVVVIDPKTGKKKVKRRVKKDVTVKKGKGRSGVSKASLE
jgi:hypothetical protein